MIKENRAEMKIGEEICTWEEKQVLYSQSIIKGRIPVRVFFLGENKRKSYRRCAHTQTQPNTPDTKRTLNKDGDLHIAG